MKKIILLFFILTVGYNMDGFKIKSDSFGSGQFLDKKFTCEGENLSPNLFWENEPKGTKFFALICDDPDAPKKEPWVHWVIFNIPANVKNLPEGLPKKPVLENGAIQGVNDSNRIGFDGPCPPKGEPHRYYFKLYALDEKLTLSSGATKEKLLEAIEGHTLGKAEIMGLYQIK